MNHRKPTPRRFAGFFASFWFFGSPAIDRPDLRHWSDDLYRAAPQFAEFEDFLSELDLDDDQEDLEEEFQERSELLKKLEAEDRQGASSGQKFHLDKQIVELLLQQSTYINFKNKRLEYYQAAQWRRPLTSHKIGPNPELEALSFKTLEVARAMVNNYSFEADTNLALLIRLMARTENANILLFFEQFKKKFPNSAAMPLVYHTVGEYHSQKKDWEKAEAALKSAMEFKDSPLRPYSIYKLGWLHLMRAENDKEQAKKAEATKKASAAFRLCLKLMDDWDAYEPVFNLKQETLSDLAWTFAESRMAKAEAQKFFEESDEEEAYQDYLYYLAVDSSRDGDHKTAEEGLKELLQLNPEDRQVPRLLLNLSESYLLAHNYSKLVDSYKDIQALFHEEAPWLEEWEDDTEFLQLIRKQLAGHISQAALRTYQEAEKMAEAEAPVKAPVTEPSKTEPSKNQVSPTGAAAQAEPAPSPRSRQQLFATSKDLYRLYADWFPQGDALEDARYNNALSFYHLGDLEKSLELLKAIAQDEKSKFRRDASYNAVLVAVAYDQKQPAPKLPEAGKAKVPVPFGKAKAALIEHIDSFLKLYPDAEDKVALQYMAAQNYFEYGNYPEALKRFDQIIQAAPETEQGESSLHTLLSYQIDAAMWTETIASCETYLKNKKITGAGHRKILKQSLQYAKGQIGT